MRGGAKRGHKNRIQALIFLKAEGWKVSQIAAEIRCSVSDLAQNRITDPVVYRAVSRLAIREGYPAESNEAPPSMDAVEVRLRFLRRMLPESLPEIQAARPDWWNGESGYRQLIRDVHAIGATQAGGLWYAPDRLRAA